MTFALIPVIVQRFFDLKIRKLLSALFLLLALQLTLLRYHFCCECIHKPCSASWSNSLLCEEGYFVLVAAMAIWY